jgi:hypothetical protein
MIILVFFNRFGVQFYDYLFMWWNLGWYALLMLCLGLLSVDSEDAFDSASEVNVHGYIYILWINLFKWWLFIWKK